MRVHDLGLVSFQLTNDGSITTPVAPRVQIAFELRNDSQVQPSINRALFERAFGADSWPGNQCDFIAVDVMLIINVKQRVLLRAADDEPRDDVGRSHGWSR